MSEFGTWHRVGETQLSLDHNGAASEVRNFDITTARLLRRQRGEHETMRVTIGYIATSEFFPISTTEDIVSNDGDEVKVLVSSLTSENMGTINGLPRVEAVEVAPGEWFENTK